MRFTIDLEKSVSSGGRWVTIKKEGPLHGRHVFIDGSGQITKGKGIPPHVLHHLNSGAGKHHLEGAGPMADEHLDKAKELARKSPDHLDWVGNLSDHPEAAKAMMKHKNEQGKSIQDVFKDWGGGSQDETPEYKPDSTKKMDDFDLGKRRIEPKQVTFARMQAGRTAEASAEEGAIIHLGKEFNKYHSGDDEGVPEKYRKLGHIVMHEIGHVISNAYPNLEKHILENPEGAMGQYNQKKGHFKGVSYTPEESFAESFALHHTDPDFLKKNYPKAAEFMKHVLSRIPDYKDFIKHAEKEMDKYNEHKDPDKLPIHAEARKIHDAKGKAEQEEKPQASMPEPKPAPEQEGKKLKVGDQELHIKDGKVLSGAEGGLHMPYVRIKGQKTANYGSEYGQDIEPHGEYMSHDSMNGSNKIALPNYEYGKVHFKNPLFIEHETTGHGGWKSKLSEQFGGKKGKALSAAVKKAGHDGIVTLDSKYGEINETVNLAGEKSNHEGLSKSMRFTIDLEKSADSGGHWVTVKNEGPLHGRHLYIDGSGQVTKGKGIPSHVLHHLNSKAGKHNLKGAEPHEPDPLLRAKQAAANHGSYGAWQTHLRNNDPEAFKAMSAHSLNTRTFRPDLFTAFKNGGTPAPKPEAEPEAHDDDLNRAKAEAPNHPSHEKWLNHLNMKDSKAYNALRWHDKKPADLFKQWGGGSKVAGPGHPAPDAHPEHVEKALQAHEKTIRDRKTELGTLHHPGTADKVWGEDQGKESEVDLRDALMKNLVKGNILTHNHPGGNSFSNEDIQFMLANGLKEMRAVSSKHLHRMQAPEGYRNTEQNFSDIQRKIRDIEEDQKSDFWDKINKGEMSPDEASARHFHELWTSAAKQLGFKYSREEHADGGSVKEDTPDYSGHEIPDAKALMSKWKEQGADAYVHESRGVLGLSKIAFDKKERGKGKGTAFMKDLIGLADRTGQRVELTPSADFGGSVSRLKDFYKRFGFVENKGKNKDFSTRETMYRETQGGKGEPKK